MDRPLSWTILATACLGVATPSLASAQGDSIGQYAGIRYQLVEDAHDGRFTVRAGLRVPVDANAGLILSFRPPTRPEDVPASPEARRLAALIDKVASIADTVRQLNAASGLLDITAMQRALREVDEQIDTLIFTDLPAAGLPEAELPLVLNGRFPGALPDKSNKYANIGRWLRLRIEALTSEAESLTAGSGNLRVQVQAFRDPVSGRRSAVHVENYDRLPEGELQEIDRFGLRLTPAEAERFQTSLRNNQVLAASLNELITKRAGLLESLKDEARELIQSLAELVDAITQEPALLLGRFDAAAAELAEIAEGADTPADAKQATRALAAELSGIRTDVKTLSDVVTGIESLRAELTNPTSGDLAQLLSPEGSLVGQVNQVLEGLKTLGNLVPTWQRRLTRVRELGAGLAARLSEESVTRGLQDALDPIVQRLSSELPETIKAVTVFTDILGPNRNADDLLEEPASADVGILHAPDDLVDARVDLRRVGWVLGDHLTIYLRFLDSTASEGEQPKTLHTTVYEVVAVLSGLHREVSTAVTFARAFEGPNEATRWKPNVAALVSWHHFERKDTGLGGAWNFLDLSLGLHLASLDQTNDSVEFGLGLNLTLLKNLVTSGYGYNLSRRTQGAYWFVGVDLMEVLNTTLK